MYIDSNMPGQLPEAQFGVLVTNLVMVGHILHDITIDTSMDNIHALVSTWSLSAISYFKNPLESPVCPAGTPIYLAPWYSTFAKSDAMHRTQTEPLIWQLCTQESMSLLQRTESCSTSHWMEDLNNLSV
jgi:hypothetical protein